MIEEWRCIKEWKTNGIKGKSYHLKGDKIYVSNTGKVRLNDIELTFDRGLYLDNKYEVKIVGVNWPYKTMHRTIYTLFIGEPHHDCYHNIHHIDCNHYNNSVDNLIELTVEEHGKIHDELDDKWGNKKQINDFIIENIDKANNVKKLTKKWLNKRVLDYYKNNSLVIQENNIKKKNERTKIKEQEIKYKINSGNYYYDKAGSLRPKTTAKKGYKMSEEEKEKHRIAAKQAYINDPTLRYRVNTKESIKKMKISLSNKRKGSKLITDNEGNKRWLYKN